MGDSSVRWVAQEMFLQELLDLEVSGARVFRLPDGIATERDFFEACCAHLPMDPPFERYHRDDDEFLQPHWDALDDSLGGGLFTVDEQRIGIAWRDSATLAAAEVETARTALEYFEKLAREASDAETNGGERRSVVLLFGEPVIG